MPKKGHAASAKLSKLFDFPRRNLQSQFQDEEMNPNQN